MRDRNDIGVLRDYMTQVSNTLVRGWDRLFFNALLNHPQVQALTGGNWFTAPTTIRSDIAEAVRLISAAAHSTTEPDSRYEYVGDTLVINQTTASEFIDSDEVNQVFAGSPLADEQLRYTGKMPKKFFGLNVIRSWQVPDNTAIVLMRRRVGFISDERPMRATPMYEDRPRETWRSDFTRSSVVAIDNPKAAVKITGINS